MVFLIVIWGGVLYKYFGKQIDTDSSFINNIVESDYNSDYLLIKDKDTFLFQITNQNPFKTSVKKKPLEIIKKSKISSRTTIVKNNSKKNIVWPSITYHGFVKGERKTTRLILLKIDNRLYKKREREVLHDIKLVKAYDDSLAVLFKNQRKTIKKQ